MNYLVYIVSFLVILSKFLDCYTTSIRIKHYREESNPLARLCMRYFGVQWVIWGIFFLTLSVVGVWLYLLHYWYTGYYWKLFYIIVGFIVTLFQFGVAHTNYTRRLNPITGILKKIL